MEIRRSVIIAAVIILFFVTGCSITGKSSAILKDEITGCQINTQLEVLRIGDVEQACYKENSVYFAVENRGSTTITGFSIFLESDYNVSMLVRSSVKPGETKSQQLFFGSQNMDGMKSMIVYPMIGDPAEKIICRDSKLTLELNKC